MILLGFVHAHAALQYNSRVRTITLTTDFGTADAPVAAMKGVIASLNPNVSIVDVSHQIPPQDVRAGAFVLRSAAPYFPRGTVHVAVVDPGVGSDRRPIALECNGHFFVGPDNGLLPLAASRDGQAPEGFHIVHLTESHYWRSVVSRTFHGRDIFAPVAAHLTLGVPLSALGSVVHDCVSLAMPALQETDGALSGEIIYVDRFGNCITNIPAGRLPREGARVRAGAHPVIPLRATYGDVARGEALALVNSVDLLEIAVREGNAAERLGLRVGDAVHVVRET